MVSVCLCKLNDSSARFSSSAPPSRKILYFLLPSLFPIFTSPLIHRSSVLLFPSFPPTTHCYISSFIPPFPLSYHCFTSIPPLHYFFQLLRHSPPFPFFRRVPPPQLRHKPPPQLSYGGSLLHEGSLHWSLWTLVPVPAHLWPGDQWCCEWARTTPEFSLWWVFHCSLVHIWCIVCVSACVAKCSTHLTVNRKSTGSNPTSYYWRKKVLFLHLASTKWNSKLGSWLLLPLLSSTMGGCSEGLGEGNLGGCSELASSSFTTVQVILGQGLIHCLSVTTVLGACITCIYTS